MCKLCNINAITYGKVFENISLVQASEDGEHIKKGQWAFTDEFEHAPFFSVFEFRPMLKPTRYKEDWEEDREEDVEDGTEDDEKNSKFYACQDLLQYMPCRNLNYAAYILNETYKAGAPNMEDCGCYSTNYFGWLQNKLTEHINKTIAENHCSNYILSERAETLFDFLKNKGPNRKN